MGTRENRFDSGALMFSSPEPLRKQLPAMLTAGIVFTAAVAAGRAMRALTAGDWGAIAAWTVGVLFIPTLELALGVWSGTSKTLEAIYTVWWYVGVVNHIRGLDFIGILPQSGYRWSFLSSLWRSARRLSRAGVPAWLRLRAPLRQTACLSVRPLGPTPRPSLARSFYR
jgi:hypothetical protein